MKDSILEFLRENLSIVLGVGGGLLLGILLLTLGFWQHTASHHPLLHRRDRGARSEKRSGYSRKYAPYL